MGGRDFENDGAIKKYYLRGPQRTRDIAAVKSNCFGKSVQKVDQLKYLRITDTAVEGHVIRK